MKLLCLFFLLFSNSIYSYTESELKVDLFSVYQDEDSLKTFKYGSILTGTLIVFRSEIVEPFQEDVSSDKPLGEYSKYGDILGQWVPNLAYSGFYWLDESSHSNKLANSMFKATLFAGGTTFFLKRLFNQRRPNKGDRNSFPSGHTTTVFAFAGFISKAHPEYKWLGYGMASFVGLSRINDNAHYLHDVTMGATIGMAYGQYFAKNLKSESIQVQFIPLKESQFLYISKSF